MPLERLAGNLPFQGLRKPPALPGGLTVIMQGLPDTAPRRGPAGQRGRWMNHPAPSMAGPPLSGSPISGCGIRFRFYLDAGLLAHACTGLLQRPGPCRAYFACPPGRQAEFMCGAPELPTQNRLFPAQARLFAALLLHTCARITGNRASAAACPSAERPCSP